MAMRSKNQTWILGAVIAASLLAVGCTKPSMIDTVLLDMSPGFETIARSHEQRMIRQARTLDTNHRQLYDDIDRILLIYRPLRLSNYSIP